MSNRLANESSPYLLQHANNPVDWYPWGDEAFELARKSNKPIFLSIGYSTCYWCHVMERQSFENPQIAAMMNEHFVNIKVDREERPDVDDIYMAAVQIMTGQGGWPMSVFLTPDLKPYYAGTYFPPEDAHGRPGMPTLIHGLSDAWHNKRDEVLAQSEEIAKAIEDHLSHEHEPDTIDPQVISDTQHQLMRVYDSTHAGFGQAPKFPQASNLLFLQAFLDANPDQVTQSALTHTLDRMAFGGIYDQVGGGFHRYSTDAQWLVPHFEKMLYDNGQLALVYANAHMTMEPEDEPTRYTTIAREICDYVLREMTDETGMFFSAQDAEVDACEGLNYLWLTDEIEKAIDNPALSKLACELYGLDKGTNFQDPHQHDQPRRNVLFLPQSMSDFASNAKRTLDQIQTQRKSINSKLLAARDKRKQPGLDDKVLVAWNGMMICGMARTGEVLHNKEYVHAAVKAADSIFLNMLDDQGKLYRSYRQGKLGVPAVLEDYAHLIAACCMLQRVTSDTLWLDHAVKLYNTVMQLFAAEHGGYFDTLANQSDLFVRTRSTYDGATPSGNSVMVHNQLDLYELTSQSVYLKRAELDLKASSQLIGAAKVGMVHLAHAQLRYLSLTSNDEGQRFVLPKAREKRHVMNLDIQPREIKLTTEPTMVTLTLDIGNDYHLNAHDVPENLTPTELVLEGSHAVSMEIAYPAGKQMTYPFSDTPIQVYTGKLEIPMMIRATGPISQMPKLFLRYQMCTDQSCLPEQKLQLPVDFVVG
ncbi:MAG: thioredoxin domain-containing protein [Phycisphaeraceae bacterium JB051]